MRRASTVSYSLYRPKQTSRGIPLPELALYKLEWEHKKEMLVTHARTHGLMPTHGTTCLGLPVRIATGHNVAEDSRPASQQTDMETLCEDILRTGHDNTPCSATRKYGVTMFLNTTILPGRLPPAPAKLTLIPNFFAARNPSIRPMYSASLFVRPCPTHTLPLHTSTRAPLPSSLVVAAQAKDQRCAATRDKAEMRGTARTMR